MATLDTVKLLLNITGSDKDNLLNVYIAVAEDDFKALCCRSDIPTEAEYITSQMAVVMYERQGAEGLTSQNFSGIADAFTDGYPTNIRRSLSAFRRVKLL